MDSTYTVCIAVLKSRIDSLLQLGVKRKDILEIVNLDFDLINDPDKMIPLNKLVDLENAASDLTNSQDIAFRIVDECKSTGETKTGILGQIAASSHTIAEAFQLAARYTRLMSNAAQISIKNDKYVNCFSYTRNPFQFNTIFDSELAIIDAYDILCKFGEVYTIGFFHDKPKYIDRYNSRFKSIIKFQQQENFIEFDSSIFSVSNPFSQPYVNKIITQYADQLLSQSALEDDLIEKVSTLILSYLATGRVGVDFIAAELNMSRQTLYRRLNELDTSFSDVFNRIRQELSEQYRLSGKYSKLEIAFLLGFSDGSAYSRASKKWESH